ncbi:MAG TPA: L-2-hydroxyglutarate oxidase, partial [Actinobacteria bacterium]|nr:L-2-hydroxyglutarate oxidase [Actinomycetota bacterium]
MWRLCCVGVGGEVVDSVDVVVIGGGIVGLATAAAVLEFRQGSTVVVLEKEAQVGTHQTGRNSGVIHSGLYYEPGSQKADFCVAGARAMHEFCSRHGIEIGRIGKVVVATDRVQLGALEALEARGSANGVETERIGPRGLAEHEPHATGVAALWVPGTSIVSFGQVASALAGQVESAGGIILVGSKVTAIFRNGPLTVVRTEAGLELSTRRLVNASGLHVDRVAEMAGHQPTVRIVPFRGEYRSLLPEARSLVRGLIYPVPDPDLPFLGVHFTKMIHGGVEVGPNAVLSLSREGYRRSSMRPADLADIVRQQGFWRLARRQWRTGL